MRRAAKIDTNQPEIVDAFRTLGWSVMYTHQLGKGCPDIVIGKGMHAALIEIKDGSLAPSRRRLTKDEDVFRAGWRGPYFVIETIQNIIDLNAAYGRIN